MHHSQSIFYKCVVRPPDSEPHLDVNVTVDDKSIMVNKSIDEKGNVNIDFKSTNLVVGNKIEIRTAKI